MADSYDQVCSSCLQERFPRVASDVLTRRQLGEVDPGVIIIKRLKGKFRIIF